MSLYCMDIDRKDDWTVKLRNIISNLITEIIKIKTFWAVAFLLWFKNYVKVICDLIGFQKIVLLR